MDGKGMDIGKFMKQEYHPREGVVPVPALKGYFEKGEKPEWKIRNLTGPELHEAELTAEKNKNIQGLLEALAGGSSKEKIEAVKGALGFDSDNVPDELAKKLEYVTMGSTKPKITIDVAVKMAEVHPITFMAISREILFLTQQGHVPGKPTPSGKGKTSRQA